MTELKSKTMVSRRNFMTTGIACLTAGCAESPVIINAYEALKHTIVGMPDVTISRDVVSKIPYATISAKIGSGPKSILILGRKENDDLHWISEDRAVIVTRHGRVVKTFGFPENLKNTQMTARDPLNRLLHKGKSSLKFRRTIDVDLGNKYSLPVHSTFHYSGPREIEIAGIAIKTILYSEENFVLTTNWSFKNKYWVDIYDGFIWKSSQVIAKSFAPIEIEVLKPAA
jgi:hypothetical protein